MRALLAFIFFLSGSSALIFESLWFRLAGLSLGNSVWSASLVLAAFMGGLALGNGLVARLHKRISYPVRLYAALEFTIGISGIAVVLLLPQFPNLLGPVLGGMTDMPVLLNAVRLTIAFTVLMIPAIAMGATLPVLAKALAPRYPNFGANIGWLYGWNTLGAMIAAFSTELFLVPALGVLNSGLVALLLNLTAAVIALRFSKTKESAPIPEPAVVNQALAIHSRTRRYITVAFFSGALMLALEVVWFRFLLLTRDGTSLIFAAMLAIVLAGIAVGGLIGGFLFQRDDRAYRWLRHVTAASTALVVLTYWGYDLFSTYRDSYDTTTFAFVLFATFLMFPVATLSGVSFTMVNRAVKDEFSSSARTAGIATFYNTIGAMLGSIGAGFILLPIVGMEFSFFLIAATYCLLSFVVPPSDQTSRATLLSSRGSIAVAIACLILFPFGLMQSSYFNVKVSALPNHTLVATREGLTETLRYYSRNVFGESQYYRLVTNGHSMSATTTAAKRYMKLYVYLPLAFKPDTRDALLISYGVGSTAKALTDSPDIEHIDIVDISEDILEMSEIVHPGDENPLVDSRVHVHIEDGRFFLNTTNRGYDLITSEPPPPKNSGVVNLYSQEYFELIYSKLNPGGYASYWLPVNQLETTDSLAIIKAFCNAFEDCSLWSGAGLDWMLMGSNDAKYHRDAEQLSTQWSQPVVAQELLALGLESPAQLGSLFMADSEYLKELTTNVAPVTDNYPSRISSRMVVTPGFVDLYDTMMDEDRRLEHFRNSREIDQLWPTKLREESERFFHYERMIKNRLTGEVYRQGSDPYVWEAIDDLLINTSLTTLPLWLLDSDQDTQNIIANLLDQDGYREEFGLELARMHTSERNFAAALLYVNDHVRTAENLSESASKLFLYLLAKNDRTAEARSTIDTIRNTGRPGMDEFIAWFDSRFSRDDVEVVGPAISGNR